MFEVEIVGSRGGKEIEERKSIQHAVQMNSGDEQFLVVGGHGEHRQSLDASTEAREQVGQTLGILHRWMFVALRYITKMVAYYITLHHEDGRQQQSCW